MLAAYIMVRYDVQKLPIPFHMSFVRLVRNWVASRWVSMLVKCPLFGVESFGKEVWRLTAEAIMQGGILVVAKIGCACSQSQRAEVMILVKIRDA